MRIVQLEREIKDNALKKPTPLISQPLQANVTSISGVLPGNLVTASPMHLHHVQMKTASQQLISYHTHRLISHFVARDNVTGGLETEGKAKMLSIPAHGHNGPRHGTAGTQMSP